MLKEDSTFIQELFARLKSSSTSAESKKDLVNWKGHFRFIFKHSQVLLIAVLCIILTFSYVVSVCLSCSMWVILSVTISRDFQKIYWHSCTFVDVLLIVPVLFLSLEFIFLCRWMDAGIFALELSIFIFFFLKNITYFMKQSVRGHFGTVGRIFGL